MREQICDAQFENEMLIENHDVYMTSFVDIFLFDKNLKISVFVCPITHIPEQLTQRLKRLPF